MRRSSTTCTCGTCCATSKRRSQALDGPVRDVLDLYCGSRPYDDLFPAGADCVGLDVAGNPYGVADVVTDDFIPFPDASFDLVTCIEAFHYVEDPRHGVHEIRRVLRPGGTAIVTSLRLGVRP